MSGRWVWRCSPSATGFSPSTTQISSHFTASSNTRVWDSPLALRAVHHSKTCSSGCCAKIPVEGSQYQKSRYYVTFEVILKIQTDEMSLWKEHSWVTCDGSSPLPDEAENCCRAPFEITAEDVELSVRSIPHISSLILVKAMLRKKTFQHPFKGIRLNSTEAEKLRLDYQWLSIIRN